MSLWAIIEYYGRALTKNKIYLISYAMQPISFIFIVYVISGGKLLSSALAGAIVSFVVGAGVADLSIELAGMRTRSKFYDIIMSLPGSWAEKMIGISLGMSLPAAPHLAVLIAVLTMLHGIPYIIYIAIGIAVLWLWSVSIGMYMGVRIKEPLTVMRLSTILTTALTIFPPVYYPIDLVPKALQPLLLAIPTVSASQLIAGTGPVGFSIASLIAWAALCLALLLLTEAREH